MIAREQLVRRSSVLWEIPRSFRADMRVPARVYASEKMLTEVIADRSLEQLVNVATLPGIRKAAIVMPDVHEGYGFPIGGVAATSYPDGVISPGGIGYDINCGVRLLRSDVTYDEIRMYLKRLVKLLYTSIPSGTGRGGELKLPITQLDEVLTTGAEYMVENGYGHSNDLHFLESNGCIDGADPSEVSENAKKRGHGQLGSIGAGNHFVEVDRVDEILDADVANVFGLTLDQIVVLIHTGSRGLGHQVATDHIKIMNQAMPRLGISVPDRELACAPLSSPEGASYFKAMAAAANFAFANRQMITHEIRHVWQTIFGSAAAELSILYDVAHNIAKIEEHTIDGRPEKLIVHRKGATRAFPPGHRDVIEEYRATGQPVIIPGSMGTASYVLVGTQKGTDESFSSSCHGAGRRMSRHSAKRKMSGRQLIDELAGEGIYVETGSIRDLAEEGQFAYKDIHDVVEVVHEAGIARKVARLRPLAVIKG